MNEKSVYCGPNCQNCEIDGCVLLAIMLHQIPPNALAEDFEKGNTLCPGWVHYGKNGKVYRIEDEDAWIEDEWNEQVH